jgi:alkylation response protein AidB-like acyl-CoA dehydrogenase
MPADPELAQAFSDYLRRRLSADLVTDRPNWGPRRGAAVAELAELSFTSVLLAESLGGLGRGASDVVPMFVEAGRRLLPLPMVDLLVAAPFVANRVGEADGVVTRAVLRGGIIPVLAPTGNCWDQFDVGVDGRLSATSVLVENADIAVGLVLGGSVAGQPALVYIASDQPGFTPRATAATDPCRSAFLVDLDAVSTQPLLVGAAAVECAEALVLLGRLAVAAETAGLMQACLDLAVQYAKERKQFGRTIGSFQAVKHLLAGVWRDWYSLDSTCEAAAAAVEQRRPDAANLVRAAKIWASTVGRAGVEQTLQTQGAIAFTAEHPHHLFLKRALALEEMFGEAADLLQAAGGELLPDHQAEASPSAPSATGRLPARLASEE